MGRGNRCQKRLKKHLLTSVFMTFAWFTVNGQNFTSLWPDYSDSLEVAKSLKNEKARMQFKLITSRVTDRNEIFRPLLVEVNKLSEEEYQRLKPLILEQSIPSLQSQIKKKTLTYEKLVLFYLYRIYTYELNPNKSLYTIVALNKEVVKEARALDSILSKNKTDLNHPIFGMPILLKDNIGTADMFTTAGAVALEHNRTNDAFILKQLKNKGALILGKVNLSEWAYYMCRGCPLGYSAIGGQTLNPYGRGIFESGGSSSGSGTSVAANYATAAVGTETSGSILSPSSQNSVVGLKPTIGLLSRTGIVPISSALDTPGPMTKNVVDNVVLLSAMTAKDSMDEASINSTTDYLEILKRPISLKSKRFGVFKNLLETDSLYKKNIGSLKSLGATIVEISPTAPELEGFLTILDADMKRDLPKYLDSQVLDKKAVPMTTVADIVAFNKKDPSINIPYGQVLLEGIVADSTSDDALDKIKGNLQREGRVFFDKEFEENQLDAILSINNNHAAYAAVAKYPAMTVPMGYKNSGEPVGLTFIGQELEEKKLLELALAFEKALKARILPPQYP